jgi:hypothetical protein
MAPSFRHPQDHARGYAREGPALNGGTRRFNLKRLPAKGSLYQSEVYARSALNIRRPVRGQPTKPAFRITCCRRTSRRGPQG